ncbi:MAG TPA: FtsK/SpoIIIE domain-containing protein, partial [Gryllotalpicola sp.]
MTSLRLPPSTPRPRPPRLSWAAFLTPIMMAGVLWLMTRSPAALAFAALGPLGAVVSLLEGRHGGGRERRVALAERTGELALLRGGIAAAHDEERRALRLRAPGAAAALAAADGPALWKGGPEAVLSLGVGAIASGVRVEGDARGGEELELQRAAARLDDAPVLFDPRQGVAVCGSEVLARAYVRGLLVQLYARLPPGQLGAPQLIDPPGHARGEWDWVGRMPHAAGQAEGEPPRCGVFPEPRQVPPGFRAVVSLSSPVAATVELYAVAPAPLTPGGAAYPAATAPTETTVAPELVSRREAEAFAATLSHRAAALGLGATMRSLPAELAFGDLPAAGGPRLVASIGRTRQGVAQLDLVADGPHAIVAGVTGSGKSELLVSWVAGMVSGRSTSEVVVLLVDFKGGTAFRPLAVLPHVTGVITDLEHGEAARALSSLSAELRRREAELARLGVRDVAEAGAALPRLVIVVDEFAAMIDAFPDFGPLFTDIAARGRALGIHLVLATQRPAGVMRDALVANCPLRLSLRVQSAADSRWVVGTDAAARLSAATPGRCVLAVDGVITEVQVARTSAADLAALAAAAAVEPAPRRPWLDPLPAVLTRAALPAEAGPQAVGVADLPEQQRRALLHFSAEQAPLLVLGAARSGKSSVLRLLAAASGLEALVVGPDREQAWDAVEAAAERCDDTDPRAPGLFLAVDDADAVCARFGEEYAAAWCERLVRVLRDGPGARVYAVVAAQRLNGPLRGDDRVDAGPGAVAQHADQALAPRGRVFLPESRA